MTIKREGQQRKRSVSESGAVGGISATVFREFEFNSLRLGLINQLSIIEIN